MCGSLPGFADVPICCAGGTTLHRASVIIVASAMGARGPIRWEDGRLPPVVSIRALSRKIPAQPKACRQ